MKRIWQRLSKREKGLVGLTFFIFLLVVARYLLVDPFLQRREWVKSQLEIQPQLLEKNIRYLNRKEKIEESLEKARSDLKTFDSLLLSGDTASVSASNLQETVQTLAAKEGTQVITTRVLNTETVGAFMRIPIQVEIGGQLDQVVNLIRGIDSADKLLVVNEMNIRSIFTPATAIRQRGAVPGPTQNLRVSLTISGFARIPAAPPPKGDSPGKSKPQEARASLR